MGTGRDGAPRSRGALPPLGGGLWALYPEVNGQISGCLGRVSTRQGSCGGARAQPSRACPLPGRCRRVWPPPAAPGATASRPPLCAAAPRSAAVGGRPPSLRRPPSLPPSLPFSLFSSLLGRRPPRRPDSRTGREVPAMEGDGLEPEVSECGAGGRRCRHVATVPPVPSPSRPVPCCAVGAFTRLFIYLLIFTFGGFEGRARAGGPRGATRGWVGGGWLRASGGRCAGLGEWGCCRGATRWLASQQVPGWPPGLLPASAFLPLQCRRDPGMNRTAQGGRLCVSPGRGAATAFISVK